MVIVRMKFFDHNQMELIFRSDLCVCVYGSAIVFRQIWKLKFFFACSKINFGSAIGEFLMMMMMNRREGEKILCYYQKKKFTNTKNVQIVKNNMEKWMEKFLV